MKTNILPFAAIILLASCSSKEIRQTSNINSALTEVTATAESFAKNLDPADASTIRARKQVPILCYHQIKAVEPGAKIGDYTVSIQAFRDQLKMLHDSGYQTILPDQLYDYLAYGSPLPKKPVMLTFDDTRIEHYTVAASEMKKFGYKGAFFIMTVAIGKKNYMNEAQIRALSDEGHLVGCHTWDHQNVKKLEGRAWDAQITKPVAQLEKITGKPVEYLAYPFGLWNEAAIPYVKERKLKAAFQLADKMSPGEPLHSIRRIIVPGSWSVKTVYRSMKNSF